MGYSLEKMPEWANHSIYTELESIISELSKECADVINIEYKIFDDDEYDDLQDFLKSIYLEVVVIVQNQTVNCTIQFDGKNYSCVSWNTFDNNHDNKPVILSSKEDLVNHVIRELADDFIKDEGPGIGPGDEFVQEGKLFRNRKTGTIVIPTFESYVSIKNRKHKRIGEFK